MKCFGCFGLQKDGFLSMQLRMVLLLSHAWRVGLGPSWSCDEGHASVDVSPLAPSSPLQSSSMCQQALCVASRPASAYKSPFSLPVLEVITAASGCDLQAGGPDGLLDGELLLPEGNIAILIVNLKVFFFAFFLKGWYLF